jgi:hypothetical protein
MAKKDRRRAKRSRSEESDTEKKKRVESARKIVGAFNRVAGDEGQEDGTPSRNTDVGKEKPPSDEEKNKLVEFLNRRLSRRVFRKNGRVIPFSLDDEEKDKPN